MVAGLHLLTLFYISRFFDRHLCFVVHVNALMPAIHIGCLIFDCLMESPEPGLWRHPWGWWQWRQWQLPEVQPLPVALDEGSYGSHLRQLFCGANKSKISTASESGWHYISLYWDEQIAIQDYFFPCDSETWSLKVHKLELPLKYTHNLPLNGADELKCYTTIQKFVWFKKVFYDHLGCIYLIKTTVKTVILW